MCYYHQQHACFFVCLSLLSVSQTSMDDSGHRGNARRLLNSRVLGVLYYCAIFKRQMYFFVISNEVH